MRQALTAVGTAKGSLAFMAIDVEMGHSGPMTPAQRVQRICEAVQAVREAGLWPVIYTQNSPANPQWDSLTGASTDFQDLPLWVSRPAPPSQLNQAEFLIGISF